MDEVIKKLNLDNIYLLDWRIQEWIYTHHGADTSDLIKIIHILCKPYSIKCIAEINWYEKLDSLQYAFLILANIIKYDDDYQLALYLIKKANAFYLQEQPEEKVYQTLISYLEEMWNNYKVIKSENRWAELKKLINNLRVDMDHVTRKNKLDSRCYHLGLAMMDCLISIGDFKEGRNHFLYHGFVSFKEAVKPNNQLKIEIINYGLNLIGIKDDSI